ncbi:hypothetical protein RvY_07011 [Ramazzottius varieornatus]|uniref:Uncharacterized protein n=1 Tax=Ramazzottius varieornatus TaxID=947166 RepID=A0A1D1V6V7_RAMVA|nr:hypothetical protein RvY_07011 [Ramazzottius varieornatus]
MAQIYMVIMPKIPPRLASEPSVRQISLQTGYLPQDRFRFLKQKEQIHSKYSETEDGTIFTLSDRYRLQEFNKPRQSPRANLCKYRFALEVSSINRDISSQSNRNKALGSWLLDDIFWSIN